MIYAGAFVIVALVPAAPSDVSGLVAVEIVCPPHPFLFSQRFIFALASCGSAVVPCDRQEHVLDTPDRASLCLQAC